ncbi:MAG: TetR/AcrR family transcriptional regulator [Ignavibacteria bacterium]|jgi:TetR/AcrR family transcriptional regulator
MSKKEIILNTALNLFATKGYDAVGVQEIVDKSGITKPTLYHYFENKRGLLKAIIGEYFANMHIAVYKASIYNGDISKTLTDTVTTFFSYASKNHQFFRLKMGMWFAPKDSEPSKIIQPYLELEQKVIEDIFINASKDHGNMLGREKAYASSFLGIINTYIGIALKGYAKLDNELVHKLVHQFMHGIFS